MSLRRERPLGSKHFVSASQLNAAVDLGAYWRNPTLLQRDAKGTTFLAKECFLFLVVLIATADRLSAMVVVLCLDGIVLFPDADATQDRKSVV